MPPRKSKCELFLSLSTATRTCRPSTDTTRPTRKTVSCSRTSPSNTGRLFAGKADVQLDALIWRGELVRDDRRKVVGGNDIQLRHSLVLPILGLRREEEEDVAVLDVRLRDQLLVVGEVAARVGEDDHLQRRIGPCSPDDHLPEVLVAEREPVDEEDAVL